jgi:hypothetical protein
MTVTTTDIALTGLADALLDTLVSIAHFDLVLMSAMVTVLAVISSANVMKVTLDSTVP